MVLDTGAHPVPKQLLACALLLLQLDLHNFKGRHHNKRFCDTGCKASSGTPQVGQVPILQSQQPFMEHAPHGHAVTPCILPCLGEQFAFSDFSGKALMNRSYSKADWVL